MTRRARSGGDRPGGTTLIEGGRCGTMDFRGTDVDVLLEDGHVVDVGPTVEAAPEVARVDARGLWLLPGWIDLQVNDIAWLARGAASREDHARRVREVLGYQARRGVTGLVLATLAAPLDEVEAYLDGMAVVLGDAQEPFDRVLIGALVEGTFMNPEYHGAHNRSFVLPADLAIAERLFESGAVRFLNVAPETSPDAIDLIRYATRRRVVVGCGHAKPHARRLREAVGAGLRYIIHLGNGPTGSSWKGFDDGGMFEESLRNDRLTVTIIVDNYHLHPEIVRDVIARKEVSRVVGVSDAGFATGLPSARFDVLGVSGEVAEGGAYLRVREEDASAGTNPLSSDAARLFGSAVGMREVFENLLNLLTSEMKGVYTRHHPRLDLVDAVACASEMCAGNPARLAGLPERGTVRRCARADLVLARIDGEHGSYRVRVEKTFVAGHAVG